MNHISKYLVGIALSLVVSVANSALIELRPDSSVVAPGGAVSFELFADFGAQTTCCGAIDITFDPGVLSYDRSHFFDFDPAFHHDSAPFEVKDAQSPSLVSIGFSNFFGGMTGAFTVGRLLLKAAPGAHDGAFTHITLADSVEYGGFFGLTSPVSYAGASVTIGTVTAVPEAASAWLFTSGLALLGIVMLRRRVDLA